MPRTPGSKKLTREKKVAVGLFLADLAARGTRAVDAVKKAMATAVKRPFDRLPSARIDKCFVTLQKVMQAIIIH
ncbi:hypothetical protein PC116_g5198 [Phytophthora cactorum]|nr:hypothetical protein PC116_g5198 [Phytophthora cactorum]